MLLLPVCNLVSPPHYPTEKQNYLMEVGQYRLDNSPHEAAAVASVAHRPWTASSCGDRTWIRKGKHSILLILKVVQNLTKVSWVTIFHEITVNHM